MNGPLLPLLAAPPLFLFLFARGHLGFLDFWWGMSLILLFLLGLSLHLDPDLSQRIRGPAGRRTAGAIAAGLLSALALYGIFLSGGWMIQQILPASAGAIRSIYAFRGDASTLRIALLMLAVIGPGEEFFWRGMMQYHLEKRLGGLPGVGCAVLLYTLVHLPAGNPLLLLAALTCGLFWGLLYHFTRSLLLVAVSHTAWDLLIFLLIPLSS